MTSGQQIGPILTKKTTAPGARTGKRIEQQLLHIYTVSHKKRDTILLSTVSPNIDRFLKFFHYQAQQKICNKEIIKDSTTPQMRRYTTL